jgi:hypothetical protein
MMSESKRERKARINIAAFAAAPYNVTFDDVLKMTEAIARSDDGANVITFTKPVDDGKFIASGLSDDVVEAGLAAWDKAEDDMENYISGVTTDWDEGMIVAAIFKAMLAEIEKEHNDG